MTPKKSTIVDKFENLELKKKSKIKLLVWHTRRFLRDNIAGHDILDTKHPTKKRTLTRKARHVYHRADSFMSKYAPILVDKTPKKVALTQAKDILNELNYTIVDEDWKKPWGGFFRLQNEDIERFVNDFFPDLTLDQARLGHDDVDLSPKILIVSPGQRLSWQLHHRRAERWRFLTSGAYYQSDTDKMGKKREAKQGLVVQFQQGERHRLAASADNYTVVAEIWQHTNPNNPSNEEDIIRISDDYNR